MELEQVLCRRVTAAQRTSVGQLKIQLRSKDEEARRPRYPAGRWNLIHPNVIALPSHAESAIGTPALNHIWQRLASGRGRG